MPTISQVGLNISSVTQSIVTAFLFALLLSCLPPFPCHFLIEATLALRGYGTRLPILLPPNRPLHLPFLPPRVNAPTLTLSPSLLPQSMLLFHGGCLNCLASRSARRFSCLYVLDQKFRRSIFAIRWNASAQCTCLFIYYTVHPLLTYSYSLYQALRSTKAAASGSMLPKTLFIGQTSTTMPPTHIAAVYSSAPSGPESCRVMMYLIHQSIISIAPTCPCWHRPRLCQQPPKLLSRFPSCCLPCRIQTRSLCGYAVKLGM